MKLYLSSYRVPNPENLYRLLSDTTYNIEATVITNAKDLNEPNTKAAKVAELVSDLEDLGIHSHLLDLRDYTTAFQLRRDLSKRELLYVCGGDPFVLRAAMRRNGFGRIVHELVRDGLVYAGESAGAIVAGSSLRGFEPSPLNGSTLHTAMYKGLGLINAVIVPHADNPDYEARVEPLRRLHGNNVIALGDKEDYGIATSPVKRNY